MALRLNQYSREEVVEKLKGSKTIKQNSEKEMNQEKKIFISHSSADSKVVGHVISILEAIGVPSEKIFCTSFEGHSIKLGQDFLQTIKEELNKDVLVLFILSENFYKSPISLCEMGATWVKTNEHIPILIPPFDYGDIKGVLPNTQGMKINEKTKLNSLKEQIENFLSISPQGFSVWERKRDNYLAAITSILDEEIPQMGLVNDKIAMVETFSTKGKTSQEMPQEIKSMIKSKAEIDWSGNFEMQLYYVEQQTTAFMDLNLYNPVDIPNDEIKQIKSRAADEWPEDFEMRLYVVQQQVESYRKLKEI